MNKNILFVLLFATSQLLGQTNTVDSLKNLLSQTSDSSKYLRILNILAFRIHRVNPDSSIFYSKKAMELADRQKNDTAFATAQYYAGIAYTVKGNYEEALLYTLQGLKTIKKIRNSYIQSKIIISLGVLYEYMEEIDKAIECNKEAIKLAQETKDPASEATALNNYAILLLTYKKDMEGALENFKHSIEIRKKLNKRYQIASSLNNIGEVYMAMEKYDMSIQHYREALKIYQEMNDRYGLAVNYKNIGKLLFSQKKYNQSINNFEKSIEYASELKLKQELKEDYEVLAEIYSNLSDYKSAYLYHTRYSNIKDSIYNEKSARQIADMKTKYETDKKELDLQMALKDKKLQDIEIKKQKLLRNALIIGAILVMIILLMVFNNASQKILVNKKD